jgi:hypothetical protein
MHVHFVFTNLLFMGGGDRCSIRCFNGKTARYDRIINELRHFYKVSLIKTGLMFDKYHLLNQLQNNNH